MNFSVKKKMKHIFTMKPTNKGLSRANLPEIDVLIDSCYIIILYIKEQHYYPQKAKRHDSSATIIWTHHRISCDTISDSYPKIVTNYVIIKISEVQ